MRLVGKFVRFLNESDVSVQVNSAWMSNNCSVQYQCLPCSTCGYTRNHIVSKSYEMCRHELGDECDGQGKCSNERENNFYTVLPSTAIVRR